MSLPPAGYYPDPEDASQRRWWDGRRWTEQRVPLGPVVPPPPPAVVAPDPWLWQSIVATVLCCLPLGVPGIVFASRSSEAARRGDLVAAAENARRARSFTLWSAGIGIVIALGYVVLVVVLGIAGIATDLA